MRNYNTTLLEKIEICRIATTFVYDYLTERLDKLCAETLKKYTITEIFKHADNRQEVLRRLAFARKVLNQN